MSSECHPDCGAEYRLERIGGHHDEFCPMHWQSRITQLEEQIERMAASAKEVADLNQESLKQIMALSIANTQLKADLAEARKALEKFGHRYCMQSLSVGVSKAWKLAARGSLDQFPAPETAYLGTDRWECPHEDCAEIRATLSRLTPSPESSEAGQ